MKKYTVWTIARGALLMAILFTGGAASPAWALNNMYDQQFYQGNGIYWYRPGATAQCAIRQGIPIAGSNQVTAADNSNKNRDYKGGQIISDEQLEKIKKFQPVYEDASKQTKIPWQVFAVIHIRESNLADYNPHNDGGSQGIYQDSTFRFNKGQPYPENGTTPVLSTEFLRQTVNAGKELQEKAGDKLSLVEKGDPDAIKDMFFGYNGRAAGYVEQAKKLGFSEDKGFEGSPYVMNRADAKRDPTVEPTKSNNTWGQVKVDYGGIGYPAGSDYGAYVMYEALAGVPSTGGGCTTGGAIDPRVGPNGWEVTGPNAMVIYYQDEEPWASKMYGPHTIKSWGCGPTSTAMAIATLNKDPSINPENMAKFFYDNGWQTDGTSWAAWDSDNALAKKYSVTLTNIGTDLTKATEALKRGSFVIVSAGPGVDVNNKTVGNGCPFACAGGHILLFRGVTSSGNFLVADPNKNWNEREDTPWPDSNKTMYNEGFPVKDTVESSIRNMWEIRK